ncbi:MAG: ParB/RepB/Spo0J family partition protein [Oscillospiraceae bacterium]|jgi:ParB family chromosome partitioning protein|nr:ParB/RepB/Spo0J family partition protein [Oscillospiraceae bacterium]
MPKPKGLGSGLEALFGSAAYTDEAGSSNDFDYISLTKIEPRRDQPRVLFEKEPLEELAASIREHGVLSPITVRPIGGGYYQIIAGERRWRAARMAGLLEAPARVIDVDDRAAMELSLVENLQRENLNPIEEAAGYKALGEEFGLTQEDIAKRMGKSRPVIANAMRLLTLPEELIPLVSNGDIPAGSARALLAIRDRDTLISAAREVVDKGLTARETEKLARRLAQKPREGKKPGVSVNYMEEFERGLEKALGRRVKIITGRANNGRFELEYYGEDDFERLYGALKTLGEGAK